MVVVAVVQLDLRKRDIGGPVVVVRWQWIDFGGGGVDGDGGATRFEREAKCEGRVGLRVFWEQKYDAFYVCRDVQKYTPFVPKQVATFPFLNVLK